jgi:hypothetical protein
VVSGSVWLAVWQAWRAWLVGSSGWCVEPALWIGRCPWMERMEGKDGRASPDGEITAAPACIGAVSDRETFGGSSSGQHLRSAETKAGGCCHCSLLASISWQAPITQCFWLCSGTSAAADMPWPPVSNANRRLTRWG